MSAEASHAGLSSLTDIWLQRAVQSNKRQHQTTNKFRSKHVFLLNNSSPLPMERYQRFLYKAVSNIYALAAPYIPLILFTPVAPPPLLLEHPLAQPVLHFRPSLVPNICTLHPLLGYLLVETCRFRTLDIRSTIDGVWNSYPGKHLLAFPSTATSLQSEGLTDSMQGTNRLSVPTKPSWTYAPRVLAQCHHRPYVTAQVDSRKQPNLSRRHEQAISEAWNFRSGPSRCERAQSFTSAT